MKFKLTAFVRLAENPQDMGQPIAETGYCGFCGDRALLYLHARDGTEAERPACRPCTERGCGSRARNGGGATDLVQKDILNAVSENDKPACGAGDEHQRGSVLQNQVPQTSSSCAIGDREPQAAFFAPFGRLPMAICLAPNDILCRKRGSGGSGMDSLGGASVYQCGSIGPGGAVGGVDTGRSPHKRQRTTYSEL